MDATLTSEQAREQLETLDAAGIGDDNTGNEGSVPGGWEPGDDESLAPEGAFLGTAKLSGQIGLLPETCAVKFTGSTGLEGQFNIGEHVKFTAEAIVSGDNSSGKVKDGELRPVGKTQTLTILSAERSE